MSPSRVLQLSIEKSMNDLQPSMYSLEILGFVIQLLSILLLHKLKKPINLPALYIGAVNVIDLGLFRFTNNSINKYIYVGRKWHLKASGYMVIYIKLDITYSMPDNIIVNKAKLHLSLIWLTKQRSS
jgi:hypothetical protein